MEKYRTRQYKCGWVVEVCNLDVGKYKRLSGYGVHKTQEDAEIAMQRAIYQREKVKQFYINVMASPRFCDVTVPRWIDGQS